MILSMVLSTLGGSLVETKQNLYTLYALQLICYPVFTWFIEGPFGIMEGINAIITFGILTSITFFIALIGWDEIHR